MTETKTIVITGASDGIGAAAARRLKQLGHKVVVVGHSADKTQRVASKIGAPFYVADFAKLQDVRQLAAALLQDYPRIDILINNAGGIFGQREVTVDGHERTFQVNYLAPFLLTHLLLDNLTASKATIINTTSIASKRLSDFDINDLELEHGYSADRAYGNSKLANVMFAQELQRRYHDQGINAVAVHPGIIASNFASHSTSRMRYVYRTLLNRFMGSSERGAEPLVWLATTTPGADWQPGAYYEKRRLARPHHVARDTRLCAELWERSLALI